MENTTCWNCFFHGCEYVQVRGISIQNPSTYANTDGIDIDCCRYVTVSDCLIDTADDAFAIRSSAYRLRNGMNACEYITISNCVLGSSSGAFRLGVGDCPIRHVRVSNITVKRAATGFILTSNYSQSLGRYTPISDISFQNITLTNTQRTCKFGAAERGVIKDVSFTNISCEVFGGSYMKSPEGKHIQNVLFENFSIRVCEKTDIDPSLPDERRPHVLWMENTAGCVFRHCYIHGTESAALPWEAAVMAENSEITTQDCNFTPKRKDTV
jgi:polygalacturonase